VTTHRDADAEATLVEIAEPYADGDAPTQVDARSIGDREHDGELVLPRGTTLGRYVVLERIGTGGMGVVYAAYDPQLDRRVALKLLHSREETDGGTGGRTRILREAQAMARLSHPNVVAVHDVGVVDGRLFIAMELIDGVTLRAWIDADARRWPEVLDVLEPAARGLAAAHAVGLVHRDFKPDNVMIEANGRVRVMDFGLARSTGEISTQSVSGESPARHRDVQQASHSLRSGADGAEGAALSAVDRLTRTGALVGTPAYMAPELLAAGAADARSDQYAFCVALWRALYGTRPFGGDSVAALYAAASQGRLRVPPRSARVPRWLAAVVRRGLQPEPADRFASMDALLLALHRGRRRRGRIALASAGALAVTAGTAGWIFAARPACTGGHEDVEAVWGAGQRARLREAFAASGAPDAEGTAARVTGTLDAWAQTWSDAHRNACRAHREGAQSDRLFDLRVRCLQHRLTALDAAAGVLAEADAEVVLEAADVASSLPDLAACDDADALLADRLQPDDEPTREAVEALQPRLARARTLERAGRYEAGLEIAQSLRDEAPAIGFRPLSAEVEFLLATLHLGNGDPKAAAEAFERATFEAEASGHDEIAARAWTLLTYVHGFALADEKAGDAAARRAEAAVLRTGNRPDLMADLLHNRGAMHLHRGKYEEALADQREALRLRLDAGDEAFDVGNSYTSIGNALYHLGRPAEAMEQYQKAYEVLAGVLGPRHPDTAMALQNVGNMLTVSGDPAGGRSKLEEVKAIFEDALGPEHPLVGQVLFNLGWAAEAQGEYAAALEAFERARAIELPRLGPEHPLVGEYEASIGTLAHKLGREAQARRHLERALAILEKAHGPEHGFVARVLNDLALVDRAQGDPAAAEQRHVRALAIRRKTLPPDHPELADTLSNLSAVLVDQRRFTEALPLAKELVEIRSQHADRNPEDHERALARLAAVEAGL
jgi:tetratricopeptide (TPR) repeat protein/predicted Ser/Thr protein kinase